jgi:hypothetical protein
LPKKQAFVIFVYRLKQNYTEVNMAVLISLFVIGFIAAALLGTQAYFRGEQAKPIHERNWRSESFEQLAQAITGVETDYGDRAYAYQGMDAYSSRNLPGV